MHATGWAGSLVVLGFAGTWALPLLTSVVAGDVFAVRGPARHLAPSAGGGPLAAADLRRRRRWPASPSSCCWWPGWPSPARSAGCWRSATSRWSASTATCWRRRTPPGRCCSPGSACSPRRWRWPRSGCSARSRWAGPRWGCCCPRSSRWRCSSPRCCRCPVAVRLALPGYAFISWNGLFTSPAQLGPLLIGIAVSLVWAVVATALAYLLFLRRDFTNLTYDGSGRRALTVGRAAAGGAARASRSRSSPRRPRATGSGIEQDKVQRSVATAFAHLYRLQTEQLQPPRRHRGAAAGHGGVQQGRRPASPPRARATTGVASSPGTCPASRPRGRPSTSSTSPRTGGTSPTATARRKSTATSWCAPRPGDAPNPLWQFDGNVDLLSTTPKG